MPRATVHISMQKVVRDDTFLGKHCLSSFLLQSENTFWNRLSRVDIYIRARYKMFFKKRDGCS